MRIVPHMQVDVLGKYAHPFLCMFIKVVCKGHQRVFARVLATISEQTRFNVYLLNA